jgi:AmmeMemoRadiSam system protein B/AmmeMemoRadiSam system protein A
MRPAAVAGQFYPGEQADLLRTVNGLLARADSPADDQGLPKALIVPHAGYRYSGAIAANAYRTLESDTARRIRRVVLLGPAHRVRLQGIAVSGAGGFETPLGRVPVDTESARRLAAQFDFVAIDDAAHRDEHSLETQLPFLQRCLRGFELVPLVAGMATPDQVMQCLQFLWGEAETLIVVSSDLSHYHPYPIARRLDQVTSNAIRFLDPSSITLEHACGQVAVSGLLLLAQQRKLCATVLDVRNSGDTSGRRDQVVGYGGFAFHAPSRCFSHGQREELTRIAWRSIDHTLGHGARWFPREDGYGPPLTDPMTCFVTLHTPDGRLRGCVGSLKSEMSLISNVAQNARMAAFEDTRFPPLGAAERKNLQLEISVLGPWEALEGNSEEEIMSQIHPFVDGLVLQAGNRRSTFLPAVWHTLPDPTDFLQQLKSKAGLAGDFRDSSLSLYRFQTESW